MGCVYTTEITLNTQHLIDFLDLMWMFLLECCDKCLEYILKNRIFQLGNSAVSVKSKGLNMDKIPRGMRLESFRG